LQALGDLGVGAPFRSSRLWAFFDSSYRSRVDLDYFAARWRSAGIAALHVAAWHFFERDAGRDDYLKKLIAACHREGILVYAWLELPHVSDRFWKDHPDWREKTGVLQDAQLDWRKLMNLANRDCFRAVSAGVSSLVGRFDWDGVNIAELYFESLEGVSNPARFTPMNPDIRSRFRELHGFDPIEIFSGRSDDRSRALFLDFRSELAREMQDEWIGKLEEIRRSKPHLDLVLTHVDDRFDKGMREAIGADAARVLPLLDRHSLTFLVEDPATVWNLGAERYRTIAAAYRGLTPHTERLAIDLNIAERYQNVYPTRQQTGTELFQLVHQASTSFDRVALYFENSILPPDLGLIGSAAAVVSRLERLGTKLVVESRGGVGIPWKGAALVDGQIWPVANDRIVWLPPGAHTIETGVSAPGLRVVRFNGDLRAARVVAAGMVEISYQSASRAVAVLNRAAAGVEIDGQEVTPDLAGPATVVLPRGQHLVTLRSR
jgi:hypothetical protein